MFCRNCGQKTEDSAAFCPICGAAFDGAAAGAAAQPIGPMGMKWFKFIIYFQLFASAVVNLFTALTQFTGCAYAVQGADVSLVASVFPGLRVLDVSYGLLLLLISVFSVLVRFRLAKFKAGAPVQYLILFGAQAVLALLYAVIASAILGESVLDVSLVSSMATSLVLILASAAYFKKRAHLFVN